MTLAASSCSRAARALGLLLLYFEGVLLRSPSSLPFPPHTSLLHRSLRRVLPVFSTGGERGAGGRAGVRGYHRSPSLPSSPPSHRPVATQCVYTHTVGSGWGEDGYQQWGRGRGRVGNWLLVVVVVERWYSVDGGRGWLLYQPPHTHTLTHTHTHTHALTHAPLVMVGDTGAPLCSTTHPVCVCY